MTTQQQLDEVNAAISAILGGAQEYTAPGGRRVRRAELSTLLSERTRLERKIAGENYDVTVAVFDRR